MVAFYRHPLNVRVYGLVVNEQNQLLVSDEYCQSQYMTKFPGGGLEYGEGLMDGLKREFMEECAEEIEIIDHFYTTDYFQESMFRGGGQLISIYYRCRFKRTPQFNVITEAYAGIPEINDSIAFRWISLEELQPEHLTWPVDKIVVQKLLSSAID
jgi:ADP-ribose pyrophosphatase YjhB (NUDIX family)